MCWEISVKIPDVEFHKNPVDRSGCCICWLTDGEDDGNSHCLQVFADAPKIALCLTETDVSDEELENFIFCGNMTALTTVHKPVQKILAKVRSYMIHVISTVHLFYIYQRTCFCQQWHYFNKRICYGEFIQGGRACGMYGKMEVNTKFWLENT
jgi:hypothetical protein